MTKHTISIVQRPGRNVTQTEKDAWNSKPDVVSSVADLITYDRGERESVFVSDPARGGLFNFSLEEVADSGVVFEGVAGYWVRQYTGFVHYAWFGSETLQSVLDKYDSIFLSDAVITEDFTIASGKKLYGIKPFMLAGALVAGTVIEGSVTVEGTGVEIRKIGVKNLSGNGFMVKNNAADVEIRSCITDVQNHGYLVEEYGTTVIGIDIVDCVAHGGIHGFVSKAQNVTFSGCKSFGASQDAYALVSDNITGADKPSRCWNNKLINCDAYDTNIGINVYSRDYFSTSNANGIELRNLTILGGNIKDCIAYGIQLGDANTALSGQTYNEVKNIHISGVSTENTATWSVKFNRCNSVFCAGNNFTKAADKSSTLTKHLKFRDNNSTVGSLGNPVYATTITVNATTIDASLIDVNGTTNNTVTTNINNVTGGKVGQIIQVLINDANTTIVGTGNITLRGANITGIGSFIVLRFFDNASKWVEQYSRQI